MYAFVAALLLMAAVAVAPGVGGFLHLNQPPVPVATSSPSVSPAPSTPSPSPSSADTGTPEPSAPPALTDSERAWNLVHKYEDGLVSGKWQSAFDLLAPTSPTAEAGFATFKSERAAFFRSVAGRYVIGEPARATDLVPFEPLVAGANADRAWFIQVDYPALAGNNAGFEQFVVAPDSTGTWRIWPVR